MGHISEHLPQKLEELQKVPEQTSLSTDLKRKLTPEENKIIQLKYKSPKISQYNEQDLLLQGQVLLLKIHVITGWTIPENELMNILIDQFVKTLSEKYPSLNTDEIEYAFRSLGTTIRDWGKTMNLNLIDQVLVPYSDNRFQISEDERRINVAPPPQRIFTQDELDNSAREAVQRQYRSMLFGQQILNPEANLEILIKDGLIQSGETVVEFYKRMAEKKKTDIYVQTAS